ncbi:MAG: hypothetical protein OXC59_00790, partial [Acidimicrobiaceae bacterium]|nr:hypothetical protein [Acidimicrobiaceae bacterium]
VLMIILPLTILALTATCNYDDPDNLTVSRSDLSTVFDDSIPVASASYSEYFPDDINEITQGAIVAFLGHVVGHTERVFLHRINSKSWPRYWVYDTIVLQADEVLVGEMPEPDSKIMIAARALTENLDGKVHSRHIDREFDIFGEGIRSIGASDSPQYLVYAGSSRPGTRPHELGLYWVLSSGGAVRVYDDGSLGEGKGGPFAEVWGMNEEGEYGWVFPYDLQDARDAAELAKAGIEDTSGTPEEQTTDLDEESGEEDDTDSDQSSSDVDSTEGTGSDDLESESDAEAGRDGSAELGDGQGEAQREESS